MTLFNPVSGTAKIFGTPSSIREFTYKPHGEQFMLDLSKPGSAMTMASIDAYNMGSDGTGPFSIALWMRSQPIQSGWLVSRFTKNPLRQSAGYGLVTLNNQRLAFAMSDGFAKYNVQTTLSTYPVNDGNWHFIAWTRDVKGTGLQSKAFSTLYINGSPALTSELIHNAINIATDAPLSIGLESGGFSGNTTDIRIWARVLSEIEIQKVMTSTNKDEGIKRDALIGEWLFKGGHPADTSPNNNNGSLVRNATIVEGGP